MPKVTYVKKAARDYPEAGIKRGQSYYWYRRFHGPVVRSLSAPRASQMTGSAYLGTVLSLLEADQPRTQEDMEAFKDGALEEMRNLQEECQASLDNMPEGLQEGSASGQMLQERIDALEDAIGTLEDVDIPTREDIEEEVGTEEEAIQDALEGLEDKTSEEALEAAQDAKNERVLEVDDILEQRMDEVWEAIQEAIGGCEI